MVKNLKGEAKGTLPSPSRVAILVEDMGCAHTQHSVMTYEMGLSQNSAKRD